MNEEAQQIPPKIKRKKTTPRYIIVKLLKVKYITKKSLERSRLKKAHYTQGNKNINDGLLLRNNGGQNTLE